MATRRKWRGGAGPSDEQRGYASGLEDARNLVRAGKDKDAILIVLESMIFNFRLQSGMPSEADELRAKLAKETDAHNRTLDHAVKLEKQLNGGASEDAEDTMTGTPPQTRTRKQRPASLGTHPSDMKTNATPRTRKGRQTTIPGSEGNGVPEPLPTPEDMAI